MNIMWFKRTLSYPCGIDINALFLAVPISDLRYRWCKCVVNTWYMEREREKERERGGRLYITGIWWQTWSMKRAVPNKIIYVCVQNVFTKSAWLTSAGPKLHTIWWTLKKSTVNTRWQSLATFQGFVAMQGCLYNVPLTTNMKRQQDLYSSLTIHNYRPFY